MHKCCYLFKSRAIRIFSFPLISYGETVHYRWLNQVSWRFVILKVLYIKFALFLHCIVFLYLVSIKKGSTSWLIKIDQHVILTRNEKMIEHYIYSYQVIDSVRYLLGSVEHELLRYIQLNLNKLNITIMMYVSFAIVVRTGMSKGPFLLILWRIKVWLNFLFLRENFSKAD